MENYKIYSDYLAHHGILGQKWGVRRFQNKDGSLTSEGKERYYGGLFGKKNKGVQQNTLSEEEIARRDVEDEQYTSAKEEIREFVSDGDVIDGTYDKWYRDKLFREKWTKNADLGLRALGSNGVVDDDEEIDDDHREWFLYEDQTFGMPEVANLVNKGVEPDQIKRLINVGYDGYYSDSFDRDKTNDSASRFMFAVAEGNYNHALEDFVDKCYELKDSIPDVASDSVNRSPKVGTIVGKTTNDRKYTLDDFKDMKGLTPKQWMDFKQKVDKQAGMNTNLDQLWDYYYDHYERGIPLSKIKY